MRKFRSDNGEQICGTPIYLIICFILTLILTNPPIFGTILKHSVLFVYIPNHFSPFSTICHNCHTPLHFGFSAMLRIWHVQACKMEPQVSFILWLGPSTHPQLGFFCKCCAVSSPQQSMCGVPPPSICFLSMLCGVPTPFVPLIKKVCAVSPHSSTNFSVWCPPPHVILILCHTWFCLGF